MQSQTNPRRIIFTVLAAVIFIILIGWFWHYFHTSKIVITSSGPNKTITLFRMPDAAGADKTTVASGDSKLAVSVGFGEYEASVEGNSQGAIQLIKVHSHKTNSYEINPVSTTGVVPVIYKNAQDVVEGKGQLLYQDATDSNIYKIDSNNGLSLYASGGLQSVKWANPAAGVGLDSNNHLYSISNGSVNPLRVPFSYGGGVVRFDVSSSGKVLIASGADIYQGTIGGAFKKIYTADSSNLALAASNNNSAIASSKLTQGNGASNPTIYILDESGKVIAKTQQSADIGSLMWSADGKYLVNINESAATIYDTSLKSVSAIPAPSAVSYVNWYGSDRLLYSTNDQLWAYNLTSQRADLIANMPSGSPVTGISISDDKSYVYLTTLDTETGGNSAIREVGLNNQTAPGYVYQLQSILPLNLGLCNLSLINFTGPTVFIQSPLGQTQQCQQQAKNELQSRGFDLNSLQFSGSVYATTE